MRRLTLAAVLAFSVCWPLGPAVVRGADAISDPIQIASGPITGSARDGVREYLGIPFAAPPVGELRWKPPAPPQPWTTPRAMTKFSPACPQKNAGINRETVETGEMSEDCLYLNVWTPAETRAEKLPVMFWIHGGGFQMGSASQRVYDGANLARMGVVVVTINYRLNIFGFLAHPELTKESPNHASGNYGLLDQIAALKWVQANISQFGGDPDNVTVFGESAGGVSVCVLMASPQAKGLFHRAIAQSGAVPVRVRYRERSEGPLASAESLGIKFTQKLGVSSQDDVLKALRSMSWQEILDATKPFSGFPGAGVLDYICVDGYVLTEPPSETLAAGRQTNIPFMAGTVAEEAKLFTPMLRIDTLLKYRMLVRAIYREKAPEILRFYGAHDDQSAKAAFERILTDGFVCSARAAVRQMSAIQPRTYLYQFTRTPLWAERMGLGCFHAVELPYVFGTLTALPRQFEDKDWKVSAQVMGYWTRFARAGDPNGEGEPTWPAFVSEKDEHLILDTDTRVGRNLRKEACDLLESIRATAAGEVPGETP